MSLLCRVLGHRWEGCRCTHCAQQRDAEHRWRQQEDACERVCEICGKREPVPHQWEHCRCARCGEQRDSAHLWLETSECERVCRICAKEEADHAWKPVDRGVDRCVRCGKTRRLTEEEIEQRDSAVEQTFCDDLPEPELYD